MFKDQNIIVGTDFSEASDAALKSADEFRIKTGGKLHVIHAFSLAQHMDWFSNDTSQPYLLSHFNSDLKESLRRKMNEQLKRCGVESATYVIIGDTYTVLHQYIEKLNAKLIVLGNKGSSGIFNSGGMTQKIVASSTIPVLVINSLREIKKIAALIDPSRISTEILTVSNEVSQYYSAGLQLISLYPDLSSPNFPFIHYVQPTIVFSEENKEQIKTKIRADIEKRVDLSSPGASLRVEVTKDNIAESLVEILEEDNIDLAVVFRHHKSFLKKFLIGSTTRKILEGTNSSLLVLPERIKE